MALIIPFKQQTQKVPAVSKVPTLQQTYPGGDFSSKLSQGTFERKPITGDDIRQQQRDMESVTGVGRIRIPFAREKTFTAPSDPLKRLITNVGVRTPEVIAGLPVRFVEFFRKNIKAVVGGAMGQEDSFSKPVTETRLNLPFDLNKRLGLDDNVMEDTIGLTVRQYEIESKNNPNRGDYLNMQIAVAKKLVPDVLDVLFGLDVAKGILRATVGTARLSARQLPESLLFKIQKQNVNPQAIKDSLLYTREEILKSFPQRISDYDIASKFIKNLSQSERAELFRLSGGYIKTGIPVPLKGEATPTALGKFAQAKPPVTGLPPKISGLLPSGTSPKPSMQAGFLNIQAMGDDFIKLAKQAKGIEEFKKALTKEQLALITARGFTAETFFSQLKVKSIVEEFKPLERGAKVNNPQERIKIAEVPNTIVTEIGLSNKDISISRLNIKHIIEKGETADEIINSIPKVLANPTKIVDNSVKRPNSFLFARRNGNNFGVVLEVIKKPEGNQIVTAMRIDNKTYDKLVDISGRTASFERVSSISPAAASRLEAKPQFSALQKPTDLNIAKPDITVKETITQSTAPLPQKKSTDQKTTALSKPATTQIQKAIDRQLVRPLSPMITQRARESTLLRRRIKNIAKGAREGSIGTKRQIKAIQQELLDIINALVPLEERGKFLATIKNIQTPEQLAKAMPEIERRISDLASRAEVREIKAQIKKELSEKLVKKDTSGVKVGKVTAEAERKLSEIRSVLKLTQEKALQELDTLLSQLGDGFSITDEIAEKIQLLKYAAGEADINTAKQLLADIKSIKETGKTLRQLAVENQKAEIEGLQTAFVDTITGGKGLAGGTGTAPIELPSEKTGIFIRIQKGVASAEDVALMTTFLMDKLSRADMTSKYMQSPLNKWWRGVFEARNVQDKVIDSANKEVRDAIARIFEVKADSKEYRKLLTEMLEVKRNIGTFKDMTGKEFTLELTPNQLMKRWAELQDESLLPTFEQMGWNKEIINAVEKAITPQEKEMARWFMDEFYPYFRDGTYDGISLDKIYEKQFGISLGKVQNYTPIQRDVDVPSPVQIIQDTARKLSTKPSSIKSRVANRNPLNLKSGLFDTAQKHITEVGHYKAFSDFVNQGRKIFVGDVKTAIRQNFADSNEIIKIIDTTFNDLAKDGVALARNIDFLNTLRGNTAVAFIGVNPVSAIKQYVSMIAWAGEMPTSNFIKGMANFAINPIEKTRFLIDNSQTLRSRFDKGSLERDIQQGMKSGNLSQLEKANTASKAFTILIRINDRVAIVGGGWGNYIYNLSKLTGQKAPTKVSELKEFIKKYPKEHKEAIKIFEEATVRTQQAGNIENLSQLQRLGSMGDLFTLFQSAPVAQFGNTLSTLRAMGFFGDPKRIPTGEGLKRLFIYLVAIPALLQFIADGFEVRPRRQAAAVGASVATLGFSNYPLFFGELITNLGRTVAGIPAFDIGTPAPASVLNEFKNSVMRNRDVLTDITPENIFQAIKDLGVVIATLKGIPAKPAVRMIEGGADVLSGESQDARRLFGWSEFALEEQGKERKKDEGVGGLNFDFGQKGLENIQPLQFNFK